MNRRETISEFFNRHRKQYPDGDFHIYKREEFACNSTLLQPNRRDFYKISLVLQGKGIFSTIDKAIQINGNAIIFNNTLIPYSWEPTSEKQTGYFCLFTEDFVNPTLKNKLLSHSPLFRVGGDHIFFPSDDSMSLLSGVFKNMFHEAKTAYVNKSELLKNYLQIILHEALKLQPPKSFYQSQNTSERISNLFLELLEMQFPIERTNQFLQLKNANEFARQLNLHTNTLNRALKESTGKTTSELIAERIIKESKALLKLTYWNIAEIAYCLGFDHPSNFQAFYKKHTKLTPLQFRRKLVSF